MAALAALTPFAFALTAPTANTADNPNAGISTAALSNANTALVLTDRVDNYDAQPFMFLTRDPANDLGMREVYLRHRNNLRGDPVPPGPVNFSFDPIQHWLVMDVINNSHKADWMVDFGAMTDGRTGLATQIVATDGQRGISLIDTGSALNPSGHAFPLHVMPGQQTTLVISLVPSDHAPFVIAPRIIDAGQMLDTNRASFESQLGNIVLVLMAGAAVFFLGCMFLRRGVGFFPHALFFLSQGAWFWLSDGQIYAAIPGGDHLAGIAMASGGLLALAVTQSILAAQDNESSDSVILYICASFVVLAIMLFIFIVPENTSMRLMVVGGATVLAYIVAAVKAFLVRGDMRWAARAAGSAWVIMLIAAIIPYITVMGFLPLMPVFLQVPAMAMPLVCVLMVLSGAAYVRVSNITLVREILRQAQRASAMNKLKQNKETADQARLLRVIEREREIMEDLRAREADRTEEMRLAKITADEANRAKSAFLAVVSHEIRTPMTGIMGMVRLLLDTQMTREQKDYSQTIQDSGDAMLALLNDILDFSKIEGGGMSLEVIDFDLHRVIHSVSLLMNGHATQRGIALNTDIDEDAPRFLKGDPTRLRQVLLNLVGNAIKFTPRGSVTIHLRAGDQSLVPSDRPTLLPVVCSVEDTGIGISEEAQKNLFNPFNQADSSIARKFGGTGLGLAICKRLIEAMGSEIILTSVEGHGTTFTFTLLLAPGDQKIAQAEGRAGEAFGQVTNLAKPMNILVIDDNPVNRKVMEGLLSRDGHKVTSAGSAKEGLDILAKTPFQLLFMDIEMPEMNGMQAMELIRTSGDPRVTNTPVVALTGNVAEEDRARYSAAGMRDTVAKPIDPERLRNILVAHGQPAKTVTTTKIGAKNTVTMDFTADELDEDSFAQSIEYTTSERPPVIDPEDIVIMPDGPLSVAEVQIQQQIQEPQAPVQTVYVPAPPEPTPTPQPTPMPATQTMDDHLFDRDAIASLRQSLGDSQLQEMMDGVFAHNKTVLPTLQTAFNDGDTETLRGCAHELKGMNGNFGLTALARASETIERACREGGMKFQELDDLVFNDLPELMARSERAFKGQ